MRFGLYELFVPSQAVGADQVHFDLYNGSTRDISVSSVVGVKDASVAVTGLVSVQLFLTRTSAVGVGGTDATEEGASLTVATITKIGERALPDGVSARLAPTSGATAGAVLAERHILPEETNAAIAPVEFVSAGPLVVPTGTGIRVVQGSVASVGNIGFNVNFY